MSSISQLQGTCNTLEKGIFKKLAKLEALLDIDGNKVTEATFNGGNMAELGKRRLTSDGEHSAFIGDPAKKTKTVDYVTLNACRSSADIQLIFSS